MAQIEPYIKRATVKRFTKKHTHTEGIGVIIALYPLCVFACGITKKMTKRKAPMQAKAWRAYKKSKYYHLDKKKIRFRVGKSGNNKRPISFRGPVRTLPIIGGRQRNGANINWRFPPIYRGGNTTKRAKFNYNRIKNIPAFANLGTNVTRLISNFM